MSQNETELPGAALETLLRARATPLLRAGGALAKLESLRPAGSAADRALGIWDDALVALPARAALAAVVDANEALAASAWARARSLALQLFIHGPVTHEISETLRLWGLPDERAATRREAQALCERALAAGAQLLPDLDGSRAAESIRIALGAELRLDLDGAFADRALAGPRALVGPAGAPALLAGVLLSLRERWPALRAVALHAATGDLRLPELPSREDAIGLLEAALQTDLASARVELRAISREEAHAARLRAARAHGLSASHAAAAALSVAQELAGDSLSLVTATGEREFSLDPLPTESAPLASSP